MGLRDEPHVPIGRLPDGTPVFDPLGRMTAVDGRRRVVRHACGALLAHISSAGLARHGLPSPSTGCGAGCRPVPR